MIITLKFLWINIIFDKKMNKILKTNNIDLLYETLIKDKSVICESPKLRKKIYDKLISNSKKFKREVLGYTNDYGFSAKYLPLSLICKYIVSKRISKKELENACKTKGNYDFEKIKHIYNDSNIKPRKIYGIILENWFNNDIDK